jgi:uncharacterized protein (DUF488 family)
VGLFLTSLDKDSLREEPELSVWASTRQDGRRFNIDDRRSAESRGWLNRNRDAFEQGSVFTIGHSNHSAKRFVDLLKGHGVEVLVDTRSRPYSRHAPHFNTREIERTLSSHGIGYLFLGRELGGRPEGEEFYDTEGRVNYALVEGSRPFLDGIHRLEEEIRAHKVVLLCSEEDPAGCHRRLLVGQALSERGISIRHIRGDGSTQTEGEAAGGQPALFPAVEVSERKSIRSVLRERRRPGSSGR